MKAEKSAQDYAAGFLSAALEQWAGNLSAVAEKLDEPAVLRRLSDQAQEFSARRSALDKVLPADVSQLEIDLLSVLMANGDLGKLRDVVGAMRSQLEQGAAEPQTAEVTSAQPLSEAQRKSLQQKLAAQFGAELEFLYKIDADILGGLVVRVGDKLIDSSVAGRLHRMRDQLSNTVRA